MPNHILAVASCFGVSLLISTPCHSQDYVPNQILVSFQAAGPQAFSPAGISPECIYPAIDTLLENAGMTETVRLTQAEGSAQNIFLIKFGQDIEEAELISQLRQFAEIESANLNYICEWQSEPNDYYYNNDYWRPESGYVDQWYLRTIQANRAWDIETGSANVKIGIVDSGVDYLHPDLMSNIWVNPAEDLDEDGVVWDTDDMDGEDSPMDADTLRDNLIGWDLEYNDNNPFPQCTYPTSRHGTMVASFFAKGNNDIGGASLAGISWNCRIVPFKGSSCADFIWALDLCVSWGVDIVTTSGGCTSPDDTFVAEMHKEVIAAYARGIVMVSADRAYPDLSHYPAAFPEVIAVSAVDENGVMCPGLAYHDYVDVCGINGVEEEKHLVVTSITYPCASPIICEYPTPLWPGSQYPHTYFHQGPSTSCSAPQVAAVAALLKSQYPTASPAFIMGEIRRGAIPVDTAAGNINQPWQYKLGAGRINPYRSLTRWGRIGQDTTWAGSVYLSGDLEVGAGKTLTIAPGTTVYVATDDMSDLGIDSTKIALLVYGTLIANGTAEHPITFRSLSNDPQPGDWYGIFVAGTSASGSFSHCVIRDAECGIGNHAVVTASNCEIFNCQSYGAVFADNSASGAISYSSIHDSPYGIVSYKTATADHCEISGCDVAGILVNDAWDSTCVVNNESTISHCTISGNDSSGASGVLVWDCPLEIAIDSCTVSDNYRGIWISDATTSISGCQMANNDLQALYCSGGDTAEVSVTDCTITGGQYGIVSVSTMTVEQCDISACTVAGIYMTDDWDSTCVVDNESVIRHCTISENDGVDASGMLIWNCPLEVTVDSCTVNVNYRGIWASNSRPTISWSEIAMNQEDGIWVTSYQYPEPYPYPAIERCQIFYNGGIGIHCQYNKAEVSYTKVYDNGSYGLLAYGAGAYPEIDHSKIIDNAISGVRAEVSGMPMLGSVVLGKGQNNALYGQYKDVYNANAAALYAENCWWGVAPPDKTKMYGSVDYTPYLTSDPVPNLSPLAPQKRKMPPAVFALEQNYPNPFGLASGTTSIRYSLPPSRQRAELKVYDVSGRLVRTLLNDVRDGDRYVAVWDGKNEHGTQVAAGIYFYKLRLGTKSMTKKMVLFR